MAVGETSITGHGGNLAVTAAHHHGQDTMWTLSGAHVFPLYDAAVAGSEPMRIIDVRSEATAAFAAEATGKLTRKPGLAVVTAGPGVTNTVSAVSGAWFNGSPMVVVGGRAPAARWGSGALQELDHPPLLAPVTKMAKTVHDPAQIASEVDAAFRLAGSPHRGPVFLDIPMDALFAQSEGTLSAAVPDDGISDAESVARITQLIAAAERPVLVLGGDVWADGAEHQAAELAEHLELPTIANGMGRGVLPPSSSALVTRARGSAFKEADLVVVVGAPLDFRLGFGVFGSPENPAAVVHIADSPEQLASHTPLAAATAGSLRRILAEIMDGYERCTAVKDHRPWTARLREMHLQAIANDSEVLSSDADPIHPARIYGELNPRLTADTVVIGDGGDFVSFAGRFIQPDHPGNWLDPGPYGCLGTGLGYAMAARVARPDSPVVLLMGDGAAGFSLMDVDTLIRHDLPVVMIVCNNSAWGLEKHPMQFLYGYDVAADLRPTSYDEVVRALGGAGETVSDPKDIGPALDRALAAKAPYLVNVQTDTAVAYPRSTTGI